MLRFPLIPCLVSAVLLASCASAGPATLPNDREWNRISADYGKLEVLLRTAPVPTPGMPRQKAIQLVLQNQQTLAPVYEPFFSELMEYFERTGDPRAAALYAAEKIRLGDVYMNVLSRYDTAVDYYQAALSLDPANDVAKARLAAAQTKRFVSMEAFAAVAQGMKADDVRRLLGMPREDWIKQVVQKGRVFSVWIYPKDDGGASAIYFDEGVVYHTNWNAALPPAKSAQ